jgi:hypothetical protein
LRPLFPAKPAPPFSGEGIVIGNAAYYTLLREDLSHVFACSQAAFGALHGWQMRQTMARDMIVPAFRPVLLCRRSAETIDFPSLRRRLLKSNPRDLPIFCARRFCFRSLSP